MKKLFLLSTFLISSACKEADVKASKSTLDNKLPLTIATTRNWEETGPMCVVDNGDVYCWGSRGFYNEGDPQYYITPTKIDSISGNVQSMGVHHFFRSCVIKSDTSLRCVGLSLNPNNVIFSSGVTKVETGSYFTVCAIVNEALKCWGENDYGLLGNGTLVDSASPVDVIGMESGVTDVSLGHSTACAIKNGAAYCWGENYAGEIGNGTTISSNIPVAIPTLSSGVTDISINYGGYGEQGDSGYAIKDGGLYVWGQNDWGQLGDGTTVDKLIPTLLTSFSSGVSQVAAGGIETCLLQNGDVYCFGLNTNGQVGITADNLVYTPRKISGITGEVIQVSAGSRRGCATTKDKVYCWGYNEDNVINSTNTNDQPVPTVVYTRK
jgi:hypothetical protein